MTNSDPTLPAPRLPPRWFIRSAWAVHRALYSVTGGRVGISSATQTRPGALRLTTIGRRTGEKRRAILGYVQDGPNIVLVAMNGWGDPEPAWWLNLQAHPDAVVDLRQGPREVRARVASADERVRLWAKVAEQSKNLDRYASLRSRETALVILEPRPEPSQA